MEDYGYYKDPRHKGKPLKKKRKKKIAVVVTLHVGEGRLHYPCKGEDMGTPTFYNDDKLANLKFMIECHQRYKPDMDYELILVDNGSFDEEALAYYKTLPYKIYKRENNGFSFGGYKYAWERFGGEYDYYLFHEQDFCPCKDGWLKEVYDEFHADKELGLVGNVVEFRDLDDNSQDQATLNTYKNQLRTIGNDRRINYNLDGAWFFTSAEVLKQVDEHGGLKVFDGKVDNSTMNEILFSQPFLECGYKIGSFGNRDFYLTDKIHTYGQRRGDLLREFNPDKLVPIIDTISRITCKQLRGYFYEKK